MIPLYRWGIDQWLSRVRNRWGGGVGLLCSYKRVKQGLLVLTELSCSLTVVVHTCDKTAQN